MKKVLIFGNSGSGKTTLAKRLCVQDNLAHLDLDTVAWKKSQVPQRVRIADSVEKINQFIASHRGWVIEGCYSDLLECVLEKASEIVFLNLPIEACIANAKSRPWEPHKYPSKEAQDKNLNMLIEWISQYDERNDTFSKPAHESLFEKFDGVKTLYTSNSQFVHKK